MKQRTLVLIKPDAVQRGLIGEVITRFERVGLKIVGAKMVHPSYEHYHHHYEGISKMISRRGQKAFDITLALMQKGPVLALVLEGVEVVPVVRKMIGSTEPKEALPGTIRGDYAHISYAYADTVDAPIANIVHASGNDEEAEAEIKHWFSEEELFNYQTVAEQFTQTGKD